MANGGGYRFGELGSFQFGRLCAALLDAELDWEERPYGRVALSREPLPPPRDERQLEPPTLVVAAWLACVDPTEDLPSGDPRSASSSSLRRMVAGDALLGSARSILLLASRDTGFPEVLGGARVTVLGPERLGQLVEADAELRLRFPAVLGIRDLAGPVASEAGRRSTADLDAMAALARVFVPTHAYERAVDVLRLRHFTVLTGPPEMGKTAIARMVALAKVTEGWEAHECVRPEQLWAAFSRDRPQVFVVDDAFGSTEYRPDAAERWALELDRALLAMDDRHWLLWTSRPVPFAAGLRRIHREHGLERFPRPAEVQVDAAALGVDEKALILFRHARATELDPPATRLVRAHGWEIVSHPHFTPERIRRFVRGRLQELAGHDAAREELGVAVAAEIQEPTTAMTASYAALAPGQRIVLLALLDAPPEPVPERELAAAVRRHSDMGLARSAAELAGGLSDHFLRLVPPTGVAWVHPSWRDLVIAEVARDPAARAHFLERCGVEGILLALSTGGGATGERVLPLLHDDTDWDTVAARVVDLVPDLEDTSVIRMLEALAEVAATELPPRVGAEAAALAVIALESVACVWRDRRAVLPVGAFEAWLALAGQLPDPPGTPTVDRTWLELAPTEPVDMGSREELVRFDDWLALVDVLRRRAPHELVRFGFPARYAAVLAAFVRDAARGVDDELEPLVAGNLRRLRPVAPAYAVEAIEARWALVERDDPWFEVRFETHPRRPEPALADRMLVERVLRDLG